MDTITLFASQCDLIASRGPSVTPQEVVVDVFGGIRATARVLGVHPSTVLRWGLPRKRNGDGGAVPQIYMDKLIAAAQAIGKPLTIVHLTTGKPGIERRVIRRF